MHAFMAGGIHLLNSTPVGVYVFLLCIAAGFLGMIGYVTPAFEGAALTVATHAAAYNLPDQVIAVQIVAMALLAVWHFAYLAYLVFFFLPGTGRPYYRGDVVSFVDVYLTMNT